MATLTIDGRSVEVPAGATVLDAARKLGIDIPTLCFREDHPPQTSCMVCLVRVDGQKKLVPSCATVVGHGMRIESETDEIREARRAALELLLSDHLGDCIAPCQTACPAGLDIPRIIRWVAAGQGSAGAGGAAGAARSPVPCDACDTRCEKVCRRAAKDHAVSIRQLVTYAAQRARTGGTQGPAQAPPALPFQHFTNCAIAQLRNCAKAQMGGGADGRPFSVHVGRVEPNEIDSFTVDASPEDRIEPADPAGFTDAEARREARRCLHCDCRRPDDCKLRHHAARYGARAARYGGARRPFEQQFHAEGVIYEPGKCIACGLCIQVAQEAGERLGLTFIGRGFNVRVGVPLARSLTEGLRKGAAECVRVCPTGALAFRDETRTTKPTTDTEKAC